MPTAGSGVIAPTGVFSVIDEAGALGGNDALGDLIPKLSSQRTLEQHTQYKMCRRRLDLRKWIG